MNYIIIKIAQNYTFWTKYSVNFNRGEMLKGV